MNKTDFMGLETLRKDLKLAKQELYIKEDEIIETRTRLNERIIPLQRELSLKETELSKDKDLRAKHDCTNQTDWNKLIKNELLPELDIYQEIQEVKREHNALISALEETIRKLKIDISDMGLKIRIRLVYFDNEEKGDE